MNITAISPVSFLNTTSLINTGQSQAHSHLQEEDDAQTAKAQTFSAASSSTSAAVAVQAFTAFQPAVQPIATLSPISEAPQPLPVDLGADSSGATPQWSAVALDVYA